MNCVSNAKSRSPDYGKGWTRRTDHSMSAPRTPDSVALFGRGPLTLLLGSGALRFGGKTPSLRTLGRLRCPPTRPIGRKRGAHNCGKFLQGSLPVAQLGPLLGGGDRQDPGNELRFQAFEQALALNLT